jgi:hypothetical protein
MLVFLLLSITFLVVFICVKVRQPQPSQLDLCRTPDAASFRSITHRKGYYDTFQIHEAPCPGSHKYIVYV